MHWFPFSHAMLIAAFMLQCCSVLLTEFPTDNQLHSAHLYPSLIVSLPSPVLCPIYLSIEKSKLPPPDASPPSEIQPSQKTIPECWRWQTFGWKEVNHGDHQMGGNWLQTSQHSWRFGFQLCNQVGKFWPGLHVTIAGNNCWSHRGALWNWGSKLNLMRNANAAALTGDHWMSVSNQNYFVTAHHIDAVWKFHSFALTNKHSEELHFAETCGK